MLTYHVPDLHTGVYIQPSRDNEQTLSVSGNQQVTLHCAGDLTSDPFPFDTVVYAPFYNTLYTSCVAEKVRVQFGSAVQRGGSAPRSVPRRATLVQGDPALHASKAFYEVVRLAAEDVERIAGAHHAESPYECVCSVVRVFPWGEEDVLGVALRSGAASPASPASAAPATPAPPPPLPALGQRRTTTVPLRTAEQRRVFLKALKELCGVPASGERSEATVCVQQVRLTVYRSGGGGTGPAAAAAGGAGGAGGAASSQRVLCAEHLFSLVPSVCDVCTSFGTTMEALCEVLVCRREGNLLDNPLLPVLLPGAATEGLSLITCISAKGRYASRYCIDACCFGCSSDREQQVASQSPQKHEYDPVKQQRFAGTRRNLLCPPIVPSFNSFQKMTGDLLLSVAPGRGELKGQRDSLPVSAAVTSPPPAAAALQSPSRVPPVTTPERRTRSPLAYLDSSVDRLLAHHHAREAPTTSAVAPQQTPTSSPSRPALQARSPFNAYDLRKQKEKAARLAEQALMDHVREAEERADAAVRAAREKTAEARRQETEALDAVAAMEQKLEKMRHGYATEEATLLVRQRVLELSCTDLSAKEQALSAALAERAGTADDLARAAEQLAELEPRLCAMRAEEQRLSTCAGLRLRWENCAGAVCREYACAVAAKVALLDEHAHALAEGVRLDAWETQLSRLQRRCAAEAERLAALEEHSRREQRRAVELRQAEAALQASLRGLETECARVQQSVEQLERRQEATQRQIASDLREAADAQEKALHDYDDSIAVLRRLKDEVQELRRCRETLREERAREQESCAAAKDELEKLRKESEAARAADAVEHERVAEEADRLSQLQLARWEEKERDVEDIVKSLHGDVDTLQNTRDNLQGEIDQLRSALKAAKANATEEEERRRVLFANASVQAGPEDEKTEGNSGAAEAIVTAELRKVIEELADATEELAEVEDVMIEESDKALLAFRRCDGELTLRVERLMDRCASFMDVESRIASRSISHISESPFFRRTHASRGGLH